MTEEQLLQLLQQISKVHNQTHPVAGTGEKQKVYFVDSLNETERNSLTERQLQILRLLEDLNPDGKRAVFVFQVFRCLQSLSLIRCVGIFAWPLILSNLPSLPSFPSLPGLPFAPATGAAVTGRRRRSRVLRTPTEHQVETIFGVTPWELERELLARKDQLETTFVDWYKSLLREEFQVDLGPFSLSNGGRGDLRFGVNDGPGTFREARKRKGSKVKSPPSILDALGKFVQWIVGLTKPDESAVMPRSWKSIRESRMLEDDQMIQTLLDKLRPSQHEAADRQADEAQLRKADGALEAFRVLFGPRYQHEDLRGLEDQEEEGEPRFVPLEVGSRREARSYGKTRGNVVLEEKTGNKTTGTGLVVLKLPQLEEELFSVGDSARGQKNKMSQLMPAAGLAASFVIQMVLAHAKAAASVAGMLSNMALAGAMIGMIRDMIMGTGTQPKIKYVYDTEKHEPGVSWPAPDDEQGIWPSASASAYSPYWSRPSPYQR